MRAAGWIALNGREEIKAKISAGHARALDINRDQRIDRRSSRIRGVRKIINSVLLFFLVVVLNRLPNTGTSPNNGTLLTVELSSPSKMPPNTKVSPLFTRTWVLIRLVLIAGLLKASARLLTASFCTSTFRIIESLLRICGSTSKHRNASLNVTVRVMRPPEFDSVT